MAKLVLKIVAALAVLLVGYNFFWGNAEEKESSRRIVGQVADLGKSVVNLLSSEKEKFDKGKYDSALEKLKSALNLAKERAAELGEDGHECQEKCEHLEAAHHELEEKLAQVNAPGSEAASDQDAIIKAIREQILKLSSDTESLARAIDE
jgi:predicted  nucleic acid-binding Zn-ribbon protein